MSRILLAWELGSNYGHLSRQWLIAERLRRQGHEIFFAVRDTDVAAQMLQPAGFGFVQAPHPAGTVRPPLPPASYSEILLSLGYDHSSRLNGLVGGWLNLMRWLNIDCVVIDHAPTALLTAYLANLPSVVIGTGFEIPPDCSPLPSIRPWEKIGLDRLRLADARLLERLNTLIAEFRRPKLQRLSELFGYADALLATYPELDHYGKRMGAQYIGPLSATPQGNAVGWQSSGQPRLFAYIRPGMQGFELLLRVLSLFPAETVVIAPGADPRRVPQTQSPLFRLYTRPVSLTRDWLSQANLAVSYGGAGTVSQCLLAGVPLLLMPQNVEQYLMCRCVDALGCGVVMVRKPLDEAMLVERLETLLMSPNYRQNARAFADSHGNDSDDRKLDLIAQTIESRLLNMD